MNRALPRLAMMAVLLLMLSAAARAGRPCEPGALSPATIERSLALAQRTAAALEASGAQVAVIARAGQDLRRYAQTYSHVGLAYKDGGQWRVAHKLNDCGSAHAAVWRQGLGDFFLDRLYEERAAIVVLSPALQAELSRALRDPRQLALMHTPAYSMLAYPWAQTYQQSNQWALETLAMTQLPGPRTRATAQAWLVVQGYAPSELRIDALTRLGARIGTAHIAFDDHPDELRYAGRIRTVTADSIIAWLAASGFGAPALELR